MLSNILLLVVIFAHAFFFVLESILWTKDYGRKRFKLSVEDAQKTSTLANNQGFYNLCISIALTATFLIDPLHAQIVRLFFLSFVLAVGLYGAFTVSPRIAFLQALPALLAILSILYGGIAPLV